MPLAPYAGGSMGASAEQLMAGWGPAAGEDRSCVQRVGSGVYNPVQEGLVGVASLAGRDPVTKSWSVGTALASRARAEWALGDLGVSTVTTFGITAPLALPSAVGRLTGRPELGDWAPDWFRDRGTRVGDTLGEFFGGDASAEDVWQPWHDDGWQAFGTMGFNVATVVLPTKVSLLKGARAAEGGTVVEGAGAAEAATSWRTAGGAWAGRVGVRGVPSVSDLFGPAASRVASTNPAKTVLTTLDRVPDNLPRPVSDDLFTNRPPRPDPAPPAPTTVHNPHTAPERTPATATAHAHPDTPSPGGAGRPTPSPPRRSTACPDHKSPPRRPPLATTAGRAVQAAVPRVLAGAAPTRIRALGPTRTRRACHTNQVATGLPAAIRHCVSPKSHQEEPRRMEALPQQARCTSMDLDRWSRATSQKQTCRDLSNYRPTRRTAALPGKVPGPRPKWG